MTRATLDNQLPLERIPDGWRLHSVECRGLGNPEEFGRDPGEFGWRAIIANAVTGCEFAARGHSSPRAAVLAAIEMARK